MKSLPVPAIPAFLNNTHHTPHCATADPDLWYPDPGEVPWGAIDICRTCPLKAPCLAHAIEYNEAGIWGGTTRTQRTYQQRPSKRQ